MPVKNNYHLPFLGGVNVEVTSNNVKSGTTVLSGEITRVASSGQEITPEVSAFFNAKSSPDIDPKKVCSEIKKSAEKNVSELIESVVEKNSNEQLESVNQNLMEPYEKRAIENLLVSGSKSDADILRRKFETANHAAQIGVINLAMLIEALKATDCTAESIQKLEENLIGLIKNDKLDNQSGFVAFHPGNLYEKVNLLRDDIEKETKKFCKSGVYEFMLDKEVIPAIHNYINRKLTVQNPETIKLIDFRGLMSSGGAEMVKHLVDTVLPKSLNRFEKNVVELRLALHEAEMLRRLIKNDTKPLSEPMPASASSKGQAKDPKNSVINVNVINNNNGFPEACAGSNKSDSIHVNRDVTYSGATGETNVPVSQSPIKENQNGSCFSDQTQQRDMGEIDDGLSRLPQVIMPNSTRLFEPIGPFRMEGQKAFPSQFPYTPTKEDLTEPLTVRRTSVSLQT
ncbi:hypothetical protein, partial [Herbaspirillum sp. Sphag64]|uniref:hypothetical protein n=2 Tax=unclassified Herbaspirillum TaxID=2624150 RepID=UPI001617630C